MTAATHIIGLVAALVRGPALLAQETLTRETSQWDYYAPTLWAGGDWLLAGAIVLAIFYVVGLYLRDARGIASRWWPLWCGWMTLLRIGVIVGLLIIFLNPHERTETLSYRPSQVAMLVDTSASMEQPDSDPSAAGVRSNRTRSDAVQDLLAQSGLIEELQQTHHVDLYTFDADVSTNLARFLKREPQPVASGKATAGTTPLPESGPGSPSAETDAAKANWSELLRPRGQITRLGDSLDKLLAEVKSKSLSGIVLLTDGANNAGRDWQAANQRAKESGIRLVTVGVGGTRPPVNLQVARIVAPSDVQLGDPFEITALVQSSGLYDQPAAAQVPRVFTVELLEKTGESAERTVIDRADATLSEDGVPAPVVFQQKPAAAGEHEYSVRIAGGALIESREDDNEKSRGVNVFDRPLKILVIAGGPMRDYVFTKNVLYRHKSMHVDVWLQTGAPGISQDADDLLFDFPKTREELFAYDVVMAFDPDWSRVPPEGRRMLEEWVTEFGGGVILVAGDVYTPRLAQVDPAKDPDFQPVLNLYPVVLEEVGLRLGTRQASDKPYALGLSQAGQAAEFLQVTDDPVTASQVWRDFPGVYRCYPTRSRKAGATIYAEFTDPLSRGREGPPVLLAGQRYGIGSSLYVGSPEIWRLRSLDEDYYDRFWVKLVRKAAEGRLKRGLERVVLLLEGRDYEIGQTAPVRARIVDVNYKPIPDATVDLAVTDPAGRPQLPSPQLQQDRNRPEEFYGVVRVSTPGRYRLELSVRGVGETATAEISVVMPQLEAADPLQHITLLQNLAEGTGGRYVPIDTAKSAVPALLPDMGHEIVLDQRIVELWDKQWVMILIGALLAIEWLTRKLLRLA